MYFLNGRANIRKYSTGTIGLQQQLENNRQLAMVNEKIMCFVNLALEMQRKKHKAKIDSHKIVLTIESNVRETCLYEKELIT